MASQNQTPNMDQFEAYFRRADMDQDGRISGLEAVAFFKGSNLPQPVLAQIWTYADQNRTGFLGRQEFYNALKLVTVAQKRELTPELVKAALFTPASAKIPAPQINLAAIPGPQLTNKVGAVVPPVSGATPTAAITSGIRGQQGLPAQQSHYIRPPRPLNPNPGFQSQPDVSGQGILAGSTMAAPRPPSSSNWLAGRNGGSQAGVTSHTPNLGVSSRSNDGFPLAALTATPQQTQQEATSSVLPGLSKSSDTSLLGKQPKATVSNAVPVKGNGFASDSLFGDAFSVAAVQPKQNYTPTISSGSSIAVSSATDPASRGPQPLLTASSVDSQIILPQQQAHQHQQSQLTVKPTQQVSVQSSAAHSSAGGNSLPGQSQLPWPRMTQSDYQRYRKIFMAVDKDRDGKITGGEARNLFLSWKLPRGRICSISDLALKFQVPSVRSFLLKS